MAFTTFDLSTAEFPDSTTYPGSYTDGMLVADFTTDGMVFWIPGMSRDLTLWYTLVIDFEITGDSPYTAAPHADAFEWRNDGDYADAPYGFGSTLARSAPGVKALKSLVIQIGPGGDVDKERVGVYVYGSVPPVTGVRWQASSDVAATAADFGSAQTWGSGQVYSIDWASLPTPTAENTTLSTPDVVAAIWLKLTLPADGELEAVGAPNIALYSGSSLASLTLVSGDLDGSNVEVTAGTYYARIYVTSASSFTSFPSIWAYKATTIYGPWTTPNPVDVTFTLDLDGNISSDQSGTTYLTQQRVDVGAAGGVATWYSLVDKPGTSDPPAFDATQLQLAITSADAQNPVTPVPPSFLPGLGWRIYNASFTDSPGGTDGSRTYAAANYRVAWFLALKFGLDPFVDSLATGWENEDGSSDTTPDAVATTGDLDITFQHNNYTDDGTSSFDTGVWESHFAIVPSAALNDDGHVNYDEIAHDDSTELFTFAGDADNLTEDASTTLTLPTGDVYGFVQWTDMPAGITENKKGNVGTTLSSGTFVVTYQAPQYRPRFDGIEVLLPLFGEVVSTVIPPLRQYPRSDGLGASSARRVYPLPPSIQASNRRAGGYL